MDLIAIFCKFYSYAQKQEKQKKTSDHNKFPCIKEVCRFAGEPTKQLVVIPTPVTPFYTHIKSVRVQKQKRQCTPSTSQCPHKEFQLNFSPIRAPEAPA